MYKYHDDYGTQSTRPPVLDPYENLIWMAKPKKNAFILNKVLGMMPLALLWLAFDSFFIAQMAEVGGSMMLFTGIFMLLHLMPVWIWLGNVITANRRWKNTVYYVTDKRILIQTGFVDQELQTVYYKDVRNVNLKIGLVDKLLGVGDIHFDLGDYYSNQKVRTLTKSFLDVDKPHETYTMIQKIVMDIQSDIEYPNAYRPEENPGYNTRYGG